MLPLLMEASVVLLFEGEGVVLMGERAAGNTFCLDVWSSTIFSSKLEFVANGIAITSLIIPSV